MLYGLHDLCGALVLEFWWFMGILKGVLILEKTLIPHF